MRVLYSAFCVSMLGALAPASACQFPVYPVEVTMRVSPAGIEAVIENNAYFWRRKILDESITNSYLWRAELVEKAEAYIHSHCAFLYNGQELPAVLRSCRYVEDPWVPRNEAMLVFRLWFPLPTDAAGTLTVRSHFFDEHHAEMAEQAHQHHEHDSGISHVFETHLHIITGEPMTAVLTMDAQEKVVDLRAQMQTPLQKGVEFFTHGMGLVRALPALPLFLCLLWCGAVRWRRGVGEAAVTALLMAAGICAGGIVGTAAGWVTAAWCAVAVLGFVIYAGGRRAWYAPAAIISAPLFGFAAAETISLAHMAERFDIAAQVWLWAGSVIVIAAALAITRGGVFVYGRALRRYSEAVWQRRLDERLRFAAFMVGIAAVLYIAHLYKGGVSGCY